MYRNKSSISLRTLAHSLKQSITMDRDKTHSRRQFKPLLRTSTSMVNLANVNKETQGRFMRENRNAQQEYLIMLETRKANRLGGTSDGKIVRDNYSNNSNSNNFADVRYYDIRMTKELMQRNKQKLNTNRMFPLLQQPNPPLYQSSSPPHIDSLVYTLKILQQQKNRLKQAINQNLSSSTNNLKSSTKYILESQHLAKQLHQISLKYNQFIQHKQQLENRFKFLQEEILADQVNFSMRVDQKENCSIFIKQYQNQGEFREEAQYVMRLIHLQYQIQHRIEKSINSQNQKLSKLQNDFNQWKVKQNIQFKQQRFKNKIKDSRMQLIKIEGHLDAITQEISIINNNITQTQIDSQQNVNVKVNKNRVRQIRQYIFLFIRKYNYENRFSTINLNVGDQVNDSMDVFLCKEGLIGGFTHFVMDKTENVRLANKQYSVRVAEYCDCLKRIQQLFHVRKAEPNTVISLKYEQQIASIIQSIQQLQIEKQQNLTEISSLQQTIDKLLAQDSLSIIQLLSKNNCTQQFSTNTQEGLYNLQQIKTRINQIKNDQQKRIKKASQNFLRIKKLSEMQTKFMLENQAKLQRFATQKQSLIKDITLWSQKVNQIAAIKQGYELKKAKCDKQIDDALTKMKQKDQVEQKLNHIQQEISKLKRLKIQEITKKYQMKKKNQQCIRSNQMKPSLSVTNLSEFMKSTSYKRTDSLKHATKLKLQNHLLTQNEHYQAQNTNNASSEFKITKDQKSTSFRPPTIDEEKLSPKAQSSPKNSQQRLSLGALNSMLLSKCNLINSTNIGKNHKSIMSNNCRQKLINKQNQNQKQKILLLQSKTNSMRNSNNFSMSKKRQLLKNTQRSSHNKDFISSTKNTAKKLSLSIVNSKPSLRKSSNQSSRQSPYIRASKSKVSNSQNLNSLITRKLLRQ